MKRDLKLCQTILETLERDEKLENTKEIGYHLLLLDDAGFIDLTESHLRMVSGSGPRSLPDMAMLTWHGHDALARSRRDSYTAELPGDKVLNWVFRVDQS